MPALACRRPCRQEWHTVLVLVVRLTFVSSAPAEQDAHLIRRAGTPWQADSVTEPTTFAGGRATIARHDSAYPAAPRAIRVVGSGEHDSSIGLPWAPWHTMALELELWGWNTSVDEALRHNMSHVDYTAAEVRRVLEQAPMLPSAFIARAPAVASPLSSSSPTALQTASLLAQSDTQQAALGRRAAGFRRLNIKSDHQDTDDLQSWNWEVENKRGMLEISSPTDLSEEEFDHAARNILTRLGDNFTAGESFQCHVESRCLLNDDRRLVALLLIFERFHDGIMQLLQVQRPGWPSYADKMENKNPDLLNNLQARWLRDPETSAEPLVSAYRRLEANMQYGVSRGLVNSPANQRDGYRNLAVNVCHLIDVECCLDCEKNDTPKFGALEFRLFDSSFGSRLFLASAVAQRLVQATCAADVNDGSLDHLLQLPGAEPAADVAPLLEFLHLDVAEFCAAFHGAAGDDLPLSCRVGSGGLAY